jgi:hypothetical protein
MDSYEDSYETLGSIKPGEFLDSLMAYQLLMYESASCSLSICGLI